MPIQNGRPEPPAVLNSLPILKLLDGYAGVARCDGYLLRLGHPLSLQPSVG